jgi:FMN-dependent oxidoreductase (nitrilotriacetate monooxygenase family)
MKPTRQLRLNVNLLNSGAHPLAWRSPLGNPRACVELSHHLAVARLAERGCLDAVFLADQLSINAGIDETPGWGWLDPVAVVPAMAAVTERLGFILTASTTFGHPYAVARTLSSLDHVTAGRIGLNLVTTMAEAAAANFGTAMPPPSERYARAAEFVAVMDALWHSWDADAFEPDPATGRFAATGRVQPIDHRGRHFTVRGPLQLPRSPQGRPLLVQAGGSDEGRALAAATADAVFSVAQDHAEAIAFRDDIRTRAVRHGRDPDDIAILPGLITVIGDSDAAAQERLAGLDALEPPQRMLQRFAARFGLDPDRLSLDHPVPDALLEQVASAGGSSGFRDASLSLLRDRRLTVRDAIARGTAHQMLVGSPERIADRMQHWFETGAADGFNIMCDVYPDGLEALVDQVVPILQARGLFRREYTADTLRGHYGGRAPV